MRRRWILAALVALVAAPLVVAAVAVRRPQWYPVLDLAMTELRLRDVFTERTPLIGLPGRIGRFPDQGSHPGPLSFYGLWPTWKLLGESAWGMQAGVLVMNGVAAGASVLVASRRGGLRLAIGITAVLVVLMGGYGISTLAEPWNPYIPLLWWFLALLCVWSVLCDDVAMLPVAVVAASMAAQTHVPYLGLCLGVGALAIGWMAWSFTHGGDRRALLRWGGASLALAALLWSPLVVDHVSPYADRSNLTMLWDHFTDPPEEEGEPLGFGNGVELLLRHLDVTSFLTDGGDSLGSLARSSGDPGGSILPGVAVLAAWAAAAVVAWRRRHEALVRLHAVVGVGLVLGTFSMSRIFGKVWYYLMLWMWGTVALLCVAVVWTLLDALDDERVRRVVVGAGVAVALVGSLAVARTAADLDPPAPQLSAVLAELVPPTAEALERDQRYVVTWDDSFYIGSQGYGLVSDLERLGFDVGVPNTWRVPVTHHRVVPFDEADGRVHLAVGAWVARWQAERGAVELASSDTRTDAEREQYERLRGRVIERLEAEGLDEVVPLVDGNLFGASLDPRLPDDVREGIEAMLELGSPGAVFLIPPDMAPLSLDG